MSKNVEYNESIAIVQLLVKSIESVKKNISGIISDRWIISLRLIKLFLLLPYWDFFEVFEVFGTIGFSKFVENDEDTD